MEYEKVIDSDVRILNRVVVEELEAMSRFPFNSNAYLLSHPQANTDPELTAIFSRTRGENPVDIVKFFLANACCNSQNSEGYLGDDKYTEADINEISSAVVTTILNRTGIDIL